MVARIGILALNLFFINKDSLALLIFGSKTFEFAVSFFLVLNHNQLAPKKKNKIGVDYYNVLFTFFGKFLFSRNLFYFLQFWLI